jgi:hypothetical protein
MPVAVNRTLQFRHELKQAFIKQQNAIRLSQESTNTTTTNTNGSLSRGVSSATDALSHSDIRRRDDAYQSVTDEMAIQEYPDLEKLLSPVERKPDPERMDAFHVEAYQVVSVEVLYEVTISLSNRESIFIGRAYSIIK